MGDDWIDKYGSLYSYDYGYERNVDRLKQAQERERQLQEQLLKYTKPAVPIYKQPNTPVEKPKWDSANADVAKDIQDTIKRLIGPDRYNYVYGDQVENVRGSYSDHASGTAADVVKPTVIPAGLEERFLHREDERVTYLSDIFTQVVTLKDPVLAAQIALAAMQKYYQDKTTD